MDYKDDCNTRICPYLVCIEDRNCGTSYPGCRCIPEIKEIYCKEYAGYCPIRDD